jgi:Xaa-Pro dipeptidase
MDGYETVDEVRPAKTASFVAAGPEIEKREKAWAEEMSGLMEEVVGKSGATVGLERLNANQYGHCHARFRPQHCRCPKTH